MSSDEPESPADLHRYMSEHGVSFEDVYRGVEDIPTRIRNLESWLVTDVFPVYLQSLTVTGRSRELTPALGNMSDLAALMKLSAKMIPLIGIMFKSVENGEDENDG